MLKKLLSVFSTSLILAASITACGSNSSVLPASPDTSLGQISSVSGPAQPRFGLGLNLNGAPKMTEDESNAPTNSILPTNIDLRAGCTPIYNQGYSEACVGFASAHGLGEYLAKKQGRPMIFSPRFVWNLGRKKEKTIDKNVGMYFQDAMNVMDNIGLVPESDFPFPSFDIQKDDNTFKPLYSESPSSSLIAEAKKYHLSKGWTSISSVHAMKNALAHGMPVVFGILVYENLYNVKADGVIPMPAGKQAGGHAILCVGYDNAKRQFIIRNSWGTEWGDKGYGYLPYDFFKQGYAYTGFTAKF